MSMAFSEEQKTGDEIAAVFLEPIQGEGGDPAAAGMPDTRRYVSSVTNSALW